MPILFCAWQKWPSGHFLLSSPWQRRQCYWLQSPEASSTTTITHSLLRISRWEDFDISQRRKIWPAVPLSFMSHPCLKERVSQERIESLNTMLSNTECNPVYLGSDLCISLAVRKESYMNFCSQGQPGSFCLSHCKFLCELFDFCIWHFLKRSCL